MSLKPFKTQHAGTHMTNGGTTYCTGSYSACSLKNRGCNAHSVRRWVRVHNPKGAAGSLLCMHAFLIFQLRPVHAYNSDPRPNQLKLLPIARPYLHPWASAPVGSTGSFQWQWWQWIERRRIQLGTNTTVAGVWHSRLCCDEFVITWRQPDIC